MRYQAIVETMFVYASGKVVVALAMAKSNSTDRATAMAQERAIKAAVQEAATIELPDTVAFRVNVTERKDRT